MESEQWEGNIFKNSASLTCEFSYGPVTEHQESTGKAGHLGEQRNL